MKYTMDFSLFSVLIPVYNSNKHLSKCIYSVLEQTYPNFEIILIDDGSTDNSDEICDRYGELDERIKVYHQTHQGLTVTRGNALEKATGDYYLFLDANDYWDTDLLETISRAILNYSCDMVIFNDRRITPKGVYMNAPVFDEGTLFDLENKVQLFEEIIKGNQLHNIWNKAVKRSVVDNVDYRRYKRLKVGIDLLWTLPFLYNAKRILYLDKAMYNYRVNPTRITHKITINYVKDITMIQRLVLVYMELLDMKDKKHLKQFYHNYMKYIQTYLSKLSTSKINMIKKKKILHKIQNISLYQNALSYQDESNITIREKIQLYLFQKNHYNWLILYENAIQKLNLKDESTI